MNITVDKKEDCTANIAIEIPSEKVASERSEIVKVFGAETRWLFVEEFAKQIGVLRCAFPEFAILIRVILGYALHIFTFQANVIAVLAQRDCRHVLSRESR